MKNVKLNSENIVADIIICSVELDGYLSFEDDIEIEKGMIYEDGVFSEKEKTLEEKKEELENRLEKIALTTIALTQKKYKLTDATGTALVIRQEYQAWKQDNSSPTPTIDGWATDKGKTREEQLQAVGYVVTFLEKSSKIQELAYSKTDKATTNEQLDTISSALDLVTGCDSVLCVLQKADEVLEILRGV